jgi:hypothetical protein
MPIATKLPHPLTKGTVEAAVAEAPLPFLPLSCHFVGP